MLFTNRADAFPDFYERYLVNGLRESFDLPGVPIRIVLRKGADGANRVDYGSFAEGMWTFPRNDGALKTAADPVAGARLRIEVRGRQVSVFLDEQRLEPVAGGKKLPSIRYPLSALRGDIGLLGSRGTTTFTDVRLRAVERR